MDVARLLTIRRSRPAGARVASRGSLGQGRTLNALLAAALQRTANRRHSVARIQAKLDAAKAQVRTR